MNNKLTCVNDCWLHELGCERKECGYWGFPISNDQRVCSKRAHGAQPENFHKYPTGFKMSTTAFPPEMLDTHDMSNKRHKLVIKTACVGGIWYAGVSYQRRYDACYGSGRACGIYDGDFATEKDAINARLDELIRSEEYYKCEEAVLFLKTKRFENKQLSLFD